MEWDRLVLSHITVVSSDLCELVNEVVGCEISLGLSYLFRLCLMTLQPFEEDGSLMEWQCLWTYKRHIFPTGAAWKLLVWLPNWLHEWLLSWNSMQAGEKKYQLKPCWEKRQVVNNSCSIGACTHACTCTHTLHALFQLSGQTLGSTEEQIKWFGDKRWNSVLWVSCLSKTFPEKGAGWNSIKYVFFGKSWPSRNRASR